MRSLFLEWWRTSDDDLTHATRAVVAATLHWRFTPFRITTWQDTPDGGSRRIAATPEPFSQRYRFHFAIVDGKPRVTTGVSG